MIRFKDYYRNKLEEAVKIADNGKVARLITSYLKKKLGTAVLYPSFEQFKHGGDVYTTVQVIHNPDTVIRFNWLHGKLDAQHLHSVTVFVKDAKSEIKFDKDISLVQSLPAVVDVIKKGVKAGSEELYLDDALAEETEDSGELIAEAVDAAKDPVLYIKQRLDKMDNGDKVATSSFGKGGGGSSMAYTLIRVLIDSNPKCFDGAKLINKNALNFKAVEAKAAGSKVKVTVAKDNTAETWVQPADLPEEELEEQISYLEKVEDLGHMIKFMVKGATNAVFVAGRGGTGKTQTVEDTLAELGKTDGNGYFKVTSSASPAAVYEILYKNKSGIVLFDDCDGALDTQDGRNLIKAATDTKHVRKVSWAKKGGNYYDPDEEGDKGGEEEDGGDIGSQLPRYFEYTGKIIFISNLSMRKLDPDGALKTRAMMIELNPTNMEIYEFMGLIYSKIVVRNEDGVVVNLSEKARREVYLELKTIIEKKQADTVNLRFLVRALCLAGTGLPNWQRMLRYS